VLQCPVIWQIACYGSLALLFSGSPFNGEPTESNVLQDCADLEIIHTSLHCPSYPALSIFAAIYAILGRPHSPLSQPTIPPGESIIDDKSLSDFFELFDHSRGPSLCSSKTRCHMCDLLASILTRKAQSIERSRRTAIASALDNHIKHVGRVIFSSGSTAGNQMGCSSDGNDGFKWFRGCVSCC
jgi:hypothetical protein